MAELFKIQRLVEENGQEVLKDVRIQIPFEDIQDKPIVFKPRAGFPEVGTANVLYIAYDLGKCYVWDNNDYKVVGSNYQDSTGSDIGNKLNITRIEGGNAQGAGWGTYKE